MNRRVRVAIWILVGLALLIGAAWTARRPIAGQAIDRTLARAGVPATYTIRDLEFGRQRLTNVVIGDPKRPDLVADWIETGTRLTWTGATVTAVRAGRVRLRGRLVGGRVSLGAIDRLLPPLSGKPFALPRLHVEVADARMRLETPAGVVGLRLAGRGRLDDGFDGRLAAVGERFVIGECAAERLTAAVRVRVSDAAPRITGPVRAFRIACERRSAAQVRADVDLAFTPALDGWRGPVRLATGALVAPGTRAGAVSGKVEVSGTARATSGRGELIFAGVATSAATAGRVRLSGEGRVGAGAAFDGRASGQGVTVKGVRLDPNALAGTPIGPIARRVAVAVHGAARSFGFTGDVAFDTGDGAAFRVANLTAMSRTGARVTLSGGDGLSWSSEGLRADGAATTGGGGLPDMRVSLDQPAPGAPIRGRAEIVPYQADGARLALTPVAFTATPGGATGITTTATLSGPLSDGRVDGLTVPLDLLWNGRDRLAINPSCSPVGFERLAVAGLTLDVTRLSLCPTGRALVLVDGGSMSGGARIAAPRIAGRLGSTPLVLSASRAEVSLGRYGFTLGNVVARLGGSGRVTLIEAGSIDGRIERGGVAGQFAGAGGRIANVPLLLSDTAGDWRLRAGVLTLNGGTSVADSERRRFEAMRSDDLRFRLANSRIAVTGTLIEPVTRARVADVRIGHDLSRGVGEALLPVPGVTFDERLQPEALTRLTFGVIADARGTVAGEGRIAWTPDGVTSTGAFTTAGLDFAAAFGPVTGVAGTIRFDDLLALRSAPAQVATVATVNPGILVTDGVVRYQTLPDARVRVEGGRWPFAGGTLTLEPSLLDFSAPRERRLTFRVDAMAADRFLQQFEFDNLDATGVFDGVLPMIFDEQGGRIENGRLQVRDGGGTLAYVGAVSQENLGTWGNFAFESLKSIRYRDLDIGMNGPLAGEMVTQVRFAGVAQGVGTKSNFLIRRLQRLPLVFNIRIKAPFRGLIDSARSFYDPRRLIQRNLPALLEEQKRRTAPPPAIIQPPASRTVP